MSARKQESKESIRTSEAKRSAAMSGVWVAAVDGLDVSHGAHELDAPGGGDLPERRPGAVAVLLDFRHVIYNSMRLRRGRVCLFFWEDN